MSSSSTTPGSPSPSPSSSSNINDPNSNLYLFTFLATLIILLVVSSVITCRACYVRLRYRRTLQRAMEQGLVLAPPDQGIKFVSPPKLYDVWLTDNHPTPSWATITPISVQPVTELYSDKVSNDSKSSLASSTSSTDTLQVSVLVAMPYAVAAPPSEDEDYLPEVALGFTQAHQPS
ncbi:hypothetical protein K438DRAFT_1813103 [Mycena galopus ATCC 62051]|nr:hypothetical protein K438DRAFT_1813103 [Mycena galopus ATCC 62051]